MADDTKKVPNFIEGSLKTPSGVALGGINVAIVDIATNTQINTTTSIDGYFNCTKDLPNGFYYIKFDDPHNRFYIPTYGASLMGLPLKEIEAHAQNDIAPVSLEQSANDAGTSLAGFAAAGVGELFARHELEKEKIKQYMIKTFEDRTTQSNLLEDLVQHLAEKFDLSAEEQQLVKTHITESSRIRLENESALKTQLANGEISREQYTAKMQKIQNDFILDPQKLSSSIRSKIGAKLKGETKEFQKHIKERATNKLINEKINDIVYKTKLPDKPEATDQLDTPEASASTQTVLPQQPTPASQASSQPTRSYMQELYSDPKALLIKNQLTDEWRNKYEDIKKNIMQEKRAEFNQLYKDQFYVTPAGNKIPMADYMLEEFELGKLRHRGSGIESQLERMVREKFETTHTRKWIPDQRKILKDLQGNIISSELVPGHTQISRNEIAARFQELHPEEFNRYQTIQEEYDQAVKRQQEQTGNLAITTETPPTPTTIPQSSPTTPPAQPRHLQIPGRPALPSIRKPRIPFSPVTRGYRMGGLARKAFLVLRSNPYTIAISAVVLLVLVFIIALIIVLVGGRRLYFNNKQPNLQPPAILPPIVGFAVDLIGPTVGNFDEVLTFRADITYDPAGSPFSFNSISVYYDLPIEVNYVSADTGIYDEGVRRISWSLANPDNQNNFAFSVKVKSKSDLNNVEGVNIFSKLYATLNPGTGTGGVIEIGAASLEEMFKQSAQQSGVPLAFLKAIAKTESGVLTYSTEETTMFKTHGWWVGRQDDAPTLDLLDWYIRRGYAYNTCAYPKSNPICPNRDVRGAMQFLDETWNGVWSGKPPPPDGNAPDRRNLYHVILGAGYHIQNMVNRYDFRYGFTQTGGNWTEIQVRAMATTYCTGNPDGNPRSRGCGRGGVGYDELVWGAYLQYSQGSTN